MSYKKLFTVGLMLLFALPSAVNAQQTSGKPKDKPPAEAAAPADNEEALRKAIEQSGGSPTEILKNLEAYLQKYPNSARRNEIERELYKLCLEVRDRKCTIELAERIVKNAAPEADVLTTLVVSLRERRGEGDSAKVLNYAEMLVKETERLVNQGARPRRLSQAQWDDRKHKALAAAYLQRGTAQADLGNDAAALSDLQKSYKLARLPQTAQRLGELAEKRNDANEAIEQYSFAFVAALVTDDTAVERKTLRRKLGQLYAAKHGSENGLGDRWLKAYDAYVKEREEHWAKLDGPDLNAGVSDARQFTLTRLDGAKFKLADYQGKTVVLNFWATWCGPCLTEMPLLEKAAQKYKDDPNVVFLALSTDEERAEVAPFAKQHKFKLTLGYAEKLEEFFRVNSIPTTLIFDGKGEIAFRQSGFNPNEDFVEKLSDKIEAAKKR